MGDPTQKELFDLLEKNLSYNDWWRTFYPLLGATRLSLDTDKTLTISGLGQSVTFWDERYWSKIMRALYEYPNEDIKKVVFTE